MKYLKAQSLFTITNRNVAQSSRTEKIKLDQKQNDMITVIEHWCLRIQNFLEDSCLLCQFFSFGFSLLHCYIFQEWQWGEERELAVVLRDNEGCLAPESLPSLPAWTIQGSIEARSLGVNSQCWQDSDQEIRMLLVPCMLRPPPHPSFLTFIYPIRVIVLYSLQGNHIIIILLNLTCNIVQKSSILFQRLTVHF